MNLLKPTMKKVVSVGILTLFPYVIAAVITVPQSEWRVVIFSSIVTISSPFAWLLIPFFPPFDTLSIFFIYPIVSGIVWYLFLSGVFYVTGKFNAVKKKK